MDGFPYRIERLTDSRLPDVQRLLAEVLRQKVTLAQIRIKYGTQYTGHQFLGSIAYDGERPIAFYGTVPQVFTDAAGRQFTGCHVSDSMTLEAYQRRGLHQRLALAAYAWMRGEGVKVVYGFHSENTYHSCKKLDWKEWGRMQGYWVPAAKWPVAGLLRRIPLLRDWQVRRLGSTLSMLAADPGAFRNSQAGTGIAVDYSREFLASRAFHRNFWIECAGVRFWISVESVVRVGDVHFESHVHFFEGLARLQAICSRLGYPKILFQSYPGSPLDQALRTRYTGFESWIVGYLPLAEDLDFQQYRPNYGDQDSF